MKHHSPHNRTRPQLGLISILILLILLFALGCRDGGTGSDSMPAQNTQPTSATLVDQPTAQTAVEPTAVPTALPPTATPRPIVATINGAVIYEDVYAERLAQFQEWHLGGLPNNQSFEQFTLQDLIDGRLIEQAAFRENIFVDPAVVDAEIAAVIAESGGDASFQVWLSSNGFVSADQFKTQVAHELLTQSLFASVTAEVADTAAAVRARYIQVDDAALADEIWIALQSGGDFAALVAEHSLGPNKAADKGDLDYFTRGTLFFPIIEEAAFDLPIGGISGVLPHTRADSTTTYFIIQVTDREDARKLTANQYNEALTTTFETWLTQERNSADIVLNDTYKTFYFDEQTNQ